MPESETYVTKQNPSIDDWLAYNDAFFSQLKEEGSVGTPNYAPLVDVDRHAEEAGTSLEDYFEQIKRRVGSLGRVGLQLVRSEMDDAWHVIVAPTEATP
jgi:hypothetical protein